jgi:hypothetical protein
VVSLLPLPFHEPTTLSSPANLLPLLPPWALQSAVFSAVSSTWSFTDRVSSPVVASMTPLNKMVTACSWLLASSALFATAKAQDASRYEVGGARVRVRCCGSDHWITGVVTSQSDASVTIDALSERRTFSRTDPAEFERSLGKPRYVIVWSTTVGAAVGYGVGYQLGGGGRSDLSKA